MKNSYRERILQEKKKLDPEQVFCSPSYEKLLQSIANEIAGEKFEQLLLYKNAEDGLLGWNDGKMVAGKSCKQDYGDFSRNGIKKYQSDRNTGARMRTCQIYGLYPSKRIHQPSFAWKLVSICTRAGRE